MEELRYPARYEKESALRANLLTRGFRNGVKHLANNSDTEDEDEEVGQEVDTDTGEEDKKKEATSFVAKHRYMHLMSFNLRNAKMGNPHYRRYEDGCLGKKEESLALPELGENGQGPLVGSKHTEEIFRRDLDRGATYTHLMTSLDETDIPRTQRQQ